MSEKGPAQINNEKCTGCGSCSYHCPFGAVMEKSYILDVIDAIQKSEENRKYKVHAIVAPAVASQFTYARTGQVISGIRELGFYDVMETALGADLVAYEESLELAEKVDFFSVGTNDLTQYTLACDRQNPDIEPFIDTHHEAILRLIEMSARNAHANGAWIGICGELAADTTLTETFLRMGIDELSVSPAFVLKVRDAVRNVDLRK